MPIINPATAGQRSGLVRRGFMEIRDQKILALRAMSLTCKQIAERVGCGEKSVYRALRRSGETVMGVITDELRRQSVDGDMVLTRLSDMFNADIGDIIEPTILHDEKLHEDRFVIDGKCQCPKNPRQGCYRPLEQWPAIWRRMLSAADVKEIFEHSKDGEGASWDKIGEVIKLKFVDPLKLMELLMRHSKVDAMAATGSDKLVSAVGDLAGSIDRAIAEGRQRASQRNRIPVNVTPDNSSSQ